MTEWFLHERRDKSDFEPNPNLLKKIIFYKRQRPLIL